MDDKSPKGDTCAVCTSIEGSGGCTGSTEPSLLRICDQYQNLINWLKYTLTITLSPPVTNLGMYKQYGPWSNQGLYCLPPQKI